MTRFFAYLNSYVGQKQMMAITGLAWCGFVVSHMLGNLLYLVSADAYNGYSHSLTSNPLIYLAEAGLVATLFGHMYFAIRVSLANRRARPIGYAVGPHGNKGGVNIASKTLAYSGMLIFVFIVLHLITFKYGPNYPVFLKGDTVRDLHRLMTEVFHSSGYFAWYMVAMTVLAAHLSHALWSSLQTLGLVKGGKEKTVHCWSILFGLVVAIGFAVNPLYIFLVRN
jgi:succinate dehydrogenase / fumarate reductase cytochrome b subunit